MQKLSFSRRKWEKILSSMKFVDERPDMICDCGVCDGYGHVWAGNGVHLCRNYFERVILPSVLVGWEGWPPPAMAEARKLAKKTKPFTAISQFYFLLLSGKEPKGLILSGASGRGKTWGPLILVRECVYKNIPFEILDINDLLDIPTTKEFKEEAEKFYRKARRSNFLFIDNVFQRIDLPKWQRDLQLQFIQRVINISHHNRFLIFSTPLDKKSFHLQTRSLPGLWDKIEDGKYFAFIEDHGKSLRKER